MLRVTSKGDFGKTSSLLKELSGSGRKIMQALDRQGKAGVVALQKATPVESALTASSWDYIVEKTRSGYSITWTNTNLVNGVPIAILLQYGHGTGTGGYVQGRDFINPALKPIFDKIANEAWKAVTSA